MNVKKIVWDALGYPLSDWKKVLIYGFIGLFTTTAVFRGFIALNGLTNPYLIAFLVFIELIVSIYFTGYFLRIIKTSLFGMQKLPQFNSILEMLSDGIKVFLIGIVFMIPIIMVIIVFTVLSSTALQIIVNQALLNGFNLQNLIGVLMSLGVGIGFIYAIFYIILILPIFIMSIVNMANNDDKLGAAFRFNEIYKKIGHIGWVNVIIWYLLTGIIFLSILGVIGTLIIVIFSLINNIDVGGLLISVVLVPYLYMYFARSAALLYLSE
jgi:hypothetical protein